MPLPSGTEYEQLLVSLRSRRPWATVVAEPSAPPSRQVLPAPDAWQSAADAWQSVPEMIAVHAADAIALADHNRVVTYGELRARASRLAGALWERGVRPGGVVALVAGRQIEYAVGVLATWQAGAAFLPLGTRHSGAWRAEVCRQSGAVAALGLPVAGLPHVGFGITAGDTTARPSPSAVPGPDDLAYVMYTSGSTGTPRLAMVEHRGLGNLASAQRSVIAGIGPHATVLQFNDPTFDGAVFDLVLALAHGGRLEWPPTSVIAGAQLTRVLRERAITHATLPAAVVRTLEPGMCPDMVCVLSVGDVCHPDTAAAWSRHHQFINAYGPTETAVWTTAHIASPDDAYRRTVPIGHAIPGCTVVILDEELRALPDGATGEICIGGSGVGRGYLGDPELTASRFVADGHLYRTGDLGRRLPDGAIEFAGRKDRQVKVRGFRVEPEHVEAALAALSGVREAVVLADSHTMTGYVLAANGHRLSGPGLVTALAARLPAHLVPDRIDVTQSWPLTASGKIDRTRLHAITQDGQGQPLTATERRLTTMLASLLGGSRIGREDSFVDFGGSSLLAAQLAGRIRDDLGKDIELSDILAGPTIAALAKAVDRAPTRGTDGPQSVANLVPRPSPAQRRVMIAEELDPGHGAYQALAVIRFAGPMNRAALAASLTDIVRRHDVLRSRFVHRQGKLCVEIAPPWREDPRLIDLSEVPRTFGQTVRDLVAERVDTTTGPLARWTLIRLQAEEHVLLHTEHHTVHDGWSFHVFLHDLVEGYQDFLSYGEVRRRMPQIGYYDFVDWQCRWAVTAQARRQRDFWRTALAGAPPGLALPRKAHPVRRDFRGRAPRLHIDTGLAHGLVEVSRRAGCSLFVTMLSAFFVLLGRFSGSDDVLVGSGFADRRWLVTEELLGMFVNTVVLRGRMDGDPSFAEFLARVRSVVAAAHDHQDLPFEEVVAELNPPRTAGGSPLVQVMFSFHDSAVRPVRETPWELTYVEALSNGSAKFDLNLVVVPLSAADGRVSRLPGDVVTVPRSDDPVLPSPPSALDGITVMWEYATDVFDDPVIESMMSAYVELLQGVVEDARTPLSRLPLLSAGRRARIVEAGKGAVVGISAVRIEQVVREWSLRTPAATAVGSRQKSLTYAELVTEADRVAAWLRCRGVGRGDVVAVSMPRGTDQIVALLGILTCGAAYLPLDPSHPAARRTALMSDCGAKIAITELGMADPTPGDPAPGETARAGDDLAYLIYTSGSTGRPKGVMVDHSTVLARLAVPGFMGLAPGCSFLHCSATTFDMSVLEIWGPLLHGAAISIPPPGWDARLLGRCLADSSVTHVAMVPSLLRHVLAAAPDAFDRVDRLLVGGEILPPDLVRTLLDRGVPRVVNIYGPTEATAIATTYEARWQGDLGIAVPIGTVLPNTEVLVLDDHGQPVPVGVPGEIVLRGPTVARGYHGQPELTAQVFARDDGVRRYRTGDVGRWRTEGLLDFAGRIDDQVKVRGMRVEPGEVENVLAALPDVEAAIVTTHPDSTGAARLIAYVTLRNGTSSSSAEIRAALAETLPGHLVPSVVTILDAFPLTSSGKVDRSSLPAPAAVADLPFTAPRDPVERALAHILASLLDVPQVGVHDDFFQLGGHSLLAMQFVADVRLKLGWQLRLTDVLNHPTIAGLAAVRREDPVERISRLPR